MGLPDTASPIELAWTALGLLGVAVNGWAVLDAALDWLALRARARDGVLALVARQNGRVAVLMLALQLVFVLLGARALALPPASSQAAGYWLVVALFLALEVSLVGEALLQRWERKRLLRRARAGRERP